MMDSSGGSVIRGRLAGHTDVHTMEALHMPATLAERLAWRDEQHFVGREPELEFFDSLMVEEPSHQVVLVHGPGGIGKSTLLREVARRAEKRGYRPTLVEGRELAPVPGEIENALGDIASVELPLIMFDTYERMSAASGYLRSEEHTSELQSPDHLV